MKIRKKNKTQYSRRDLRLGFSLAELAIVILILGIILTVIFSVMSGLVGITTRTNPSQEIKKTASFALQVIKSSIDQTYFISNYKRLWFVGTKDGYDGARKDRLTFASVLSGAEDLGASAVREVSFYLKPNDRGGLFSLMRREDEIVDDEPGKGGNHYVLLANVSSLGFRYQTETKDWVENWDTREKNRLPLLIEIEIIIKTSFKEFKFKTLSRPGINVK